MNGVDRELRDWLRSLAVSGDSAGPRTHDAVLSSGAADISSGSLRTARSRRR